MTAQGFVRWLSCFNAPVRSLRVSDGEQTNRSRGWAAYGRPRCPSCAALNNKARQRNPGEQQQQAARDEVSRGCLHDLRATHGARDMDIDIAAGLDVCDSPTKQAFLKDQRTYEKLIKAGKSPRAMRWSGLYAATPTLLDRGRFR